jgi:site-specific DNA recombinase
MARRADTVIAAVYARKSTDEPGKAREAKSVENQSKDGKKYAAEQGWVVPPELDFGDDGISGAEFEERPGLMRMLSMLPRPPFQKLIVSEQKTIGREASQTAYVIKQLAEAGVEVFGFLERKSLTPKNWLDKAMSSIRAWADEAAVADSSIRVHAAHTRMFHEGKCVGGRVFGYKNVDVFKGVDRDGRPLRSHVVREINPKEAAVVERIFKLYDSGCGLKRIAHQLNAENAPKPAWRRKSDTGLAPVAAWSPATVRSVLRQELYRGVAIWNKTRKKNDWFKLDPIDRPKSEWQEVKLPHLRIIAEPLWKRVAARRQEVERSVLRFDSGRMHGRPPKHDTQNLLVGLATCGECGGGLTVETGGKKRGRYPEYICHRRRAYGTCENRLRVRVTEMNEAVLQALEAHALTPEAIEHVVALTERDDTLDRQRVLQHERKDVEKRIARLVAALETGGEVPSVMAKVRELERRVVEINAELLGLRPLPRLPTPLIESHLEQWRRLLRGSIIQSRAVIQRIIKGRITFTPRADGQGYDFEAETRFEKLFSGVAIPRPVWVPTDATGTEHIRAEDTCDEDYGALLAAVLASTLKGKRARRDLNPRPTGSKPGALSN